MHNQARYQSHGQHNDREVVLAELQQSTVILQRFRLKITADYAQPARPKAHVKTIRGAHTKDCGWGPLREKL